MYAEPCLLTRRLPRPYVREPRLSQVREERKAKEYRNPQPTFTDLERTRQVLSA